MKEKAINFLKDKYLEIIIVLLGILIGFGVGQLINFNQGVTIEQKQKCRKFGEDVYERYIDRHGIGNLLEPKYAYNKALDTCVVYIEYHSSDSDVQTHIIRNSITNKVLAKYIWVSGMSEEQKEDKKTEKKIFETNKQRLFNDKKTLGTD